jgi:dynein heavy chain
MYIFGKFDAFCKRIQKLMDMFNIIETFSQLSKLAIEGLEPIIKRFVNALSQIQRKPYDMLDHRKAEYDTDCSNFKKQVADLESNVQHFIDHAFDNIISTEHSIKLLSKFGQIKDLQLDLESKAQLLFAHYLKKDLAGVRKLY